MSLQSAEVMLKNEGGGEPRKKSAEAGRGNFHRVDTTLLRKGNEREVPSIPSGVEMPSLAGKNMM